MKFDNDMIDLLIKMLSADQVDAWEKTHLVKYEFRHTYVDIFLRRETVTIGDDHAAFNELQYNVEFPVLDRMGNPVGDPMYNQYHTVTIRPHHPQYKLFHEGFEAIVAYRESNERTLKDFKTALNCLKHNIKL